MIVVMFTCSPRDLCAILLAAVLTVAVAVALVLVAGVPGV